METPEYNFKLMAKPVGNLGTPTPGSPQAAPRGPATSPKGFKWLFDKSWVLEALCRHWVLVLAAGLGLAAAGTLWGLCYLPQTAIVRMQAVNAGKTSTERLPVVADKSVEVKPGKDPNSVEIRVSSDTAVQAMEKASALTQSLLGYSHSNVIEKLQKVDADLAAANRRLTEAVRDSNFADLEKGASGYLLQHEDLSKKLESMRIEMDTLDLQISNLMQLIVQHHPALMSARKALEEGLLRYTEEHPRIQEYRRNIRLIEARISEKSASGDPEIALTGSSLAQSLYAKAIDLRSQRMAVGKQWEETQGLRTKLEGKIASVSDRQLAYVKAKSEYDALRSARDTLEREREESQLAQGGWRVTQPAQLEDVLARQIAVALCGVRGGLLGLLGVGLLVALVEVSDRRIRSALELQRVTGLPLLGTLGDLQKMTEAERRTWAFQSLTALQGKVAGSSQQALVCGIVSSEAGEGRSTWMRLLADAARERGYRVLGLDFNQARATDDQKVVGMGTAEIEPQDLTRTALVKRPNDEDRLSPPLNWAWNLERRTQWQGVLEQLKAMQNLVVLFELPPASAAEATLLAENVSPLLWLCGRDRANSNTTVNQLETLRNARGHVVGALFNDGPRRCKNSSARTAKVTATVLLMAGLFVSASFGQAAAPRTRTTNAPAPMAVTEMPSTPPATPYATVSPSNLAEWQKRLTLGPGDILSIALFGQPDTVRPTVVIGPDGRLNYLQAQDFTAAGLTIDELRDQLEKTLLKYYQPPLRIIIVPQTFKSKKYYVLGNVVGSGVYPLDRPMTVIEAIASAGGFVSVAAHRHNMNLADLSRSFLVRKEATGEFRRMDVNFEKLFLQGDLTQNVALAPDDYLYFPPMDVPEVYVLGEVLRPGVASYTPGMSAIKAIASAGGFTPKAWRQKVLIVRGSLTAPKTFVLDAGDVLTARTMDFKLEPRDIVFVYRKPWSRVEELLEIAITDFLDAAIITYTGQHVGPFITSPIIN